MGDIKVPFIRKRSVFIAFWRIQIRPVSDLRNKFPDIEKIVNAGELVYLNKGTFNVRISLELHRNIAVYAIEHGKSLNAAVEEAIGNMVRT